MIPYISIVCSVLLIVNIHRDWLSGKRYRLFKVVNFLAIVGLAATQAAVMNFGWMFFWVGVITIGYWRELTYLEPMIIPREEEDESRPGTENADQSHPD